ncbi:MAG TPA: kynurenine 3-monooxygenase [Chitinophagaceae bacterium]|nr:kynurenine 3-monooxygenase [Chitinophagaceae bacterium]
MAKHVTVIGAGLVGSLLSIYLSRRGYRVSIYERRPDMRKASISAGRSINLALSDRGIKALEEVGIMDDIRPIAIPMHGRFMHHIDGTHSYQPYGKEGQFINSVSRGELNRKLMDLAEKHGVDIHFNHRCDHVNWNKYEISFTDTEQQRSVTSNQDLIFGSDGAFSAARLSHQLQHDRFQYQQYYIDFGYKELTIPPGPGNSFLMEKNALHIWPRGNYMLIALPNTDGSFTCTLFFPFEGDPSFASLDTPEKARQFFNETFADASAMMPDLEKEFVQNATSSLVTVKCFPWIRGDRFALIGDAAHAIVPFFGQGMNCGFEDCSVLNALMEKHADNWSDILPEYQTLRKPDGDAIADLALNNFVEMRDKVADPTFLLQKKIEASFSMKHPDKWIPAYAQVTFSPHIRYSEALRNGSRQEKIMQKIMSMPDIANRWQDEQVEKMILQELQQQPS